jgi:NAD(P)-dependent dehydrogenase (short-subunit alcohol dehydrogenase family)
VSVLITGASSGIGAATAKVFASNGHDLLLLGRNLERLENTALACRKIDANIRIKILAQDLNGLDFKMVEEKLKTISPLTILVNNAGIYQQASITESTAKIWEDMFQTNLLSTVKLTHFCWDIFLKNKNGSIVNVSSTLGVKPIPQTSAYSALKAAMTNWTLSLAQEGGPLNIRANCVCPGIIDTPIHPFHTLAETEKKSVEEQIANIQLLQNLGKPEDVAESIYFLASDKSKFTTGSILHVDGGINIK